MKKSRIPVRLALLALVLLSFPLVAGTSGAEIRKCLANAIPHHQLVLRQSMTKKSNPHCMRSAQFLTLGLIKAMQATGKDPYADPQIQGQLGHIVKRFDRWYAKNHRQAELVSYISVILVDCLKQADFEKHKGLPSRAKLTKLLEKCNSLLTHGALPSGFYIRYLDPNDKRRALLIKEIEADPSGRPYMVGTNWALYALRQNADYFRANKLAFDQQKVDATLKNLLASLAPGINMDPESNLNPWQQTKNSGNQTMDALICLEVISQLSTDEKVRKDARQIARLGEAAVKKDLMWELEKQSFPVRWALLGDVRNTRKLFDRTWINDVAPTMAAWLDQTAVKIRQDPKYDIFDQGVNKSTNGDLLLTLAMAQLTGYRIDQATPAARHWQTD